VSGLELVAGQTFGPTDTVTLDGKEFVLCSFDRCEIVYHGGPTHIHAGCPFSGCTVKFFDAAWNTAKVLMRLGYTITSSAGQHPETEFLQ
jgi:hypothetical protein